MKSRTHLKRKEVDDVLGGDSSWGNQTNGNTSTAILVGLSHLLIAPCPKCDHPMAHFMELQIRSADEPMTICEQFSPHLAHNSTVPLLLVYKCANKECGFQWKEN